MAKPKDVELIAREISRGRSSKIVTRGLVSKGEPYIDLRTYYLDDNDEWQPTKKGIRLHAEALPELIEQLQASDEEIVEYVGTVVKS